MLNLTVSTPERANRSAFLRDRTVHVLLESFPHGRVPGIDPLGRTRFRVFKSDQADIGQRFLRGSMISSATRSCFLFASLSSRSKFSV